MGLQRLRLRSWQFAALLLALGCTSQRPLAEAGGIRVESGYAHPAAGDVAAAYLRVRNTGGSSDTLAEVSGDSFGHAMVMGTTGGRMEAMAPMVISPGQLVRMAPGGIHVMLEGVTSNPAIGDTLHLILHFSHAGEIPIAIPVVAYGEMPE